MPISDFVDVSITTTTTRLQAAGFGVPLILASDVPAAFTERTRTYSSLAGMVTDGFATSHPAYLAAAKFASQEPGVDEWMVGRCALPPTQRIKLTPSASNSTAYTVKVNGTAATYTSDGSATVAEICTGLAAAITALGVSNLTAADGTTLVTITMAAGKFCSVEVMDTSLITVIQDHADPGLATDLANIAIEDSTWYGIHHSFNSKACIEAIAAYAESNTKFFAAQTIDNAVENTALSGTDDVCESLKSTGYVRTVPIYSRQIANFVDASFLGYFLATTPGSVTMNLKTLAGTTAHTYTVTQQSHLAAKYCSYYYTVAGENVFTDSKTSSGEWADIIRDRDWMKARIQERAFAKLQSAGKIPFTDAGISVLEAELKAQLAEGVRLGILKASPAPTTSVPLAADISDAERSARRLTDDNAIKFDAEMAGAIHLVDFSGTLSA